MNNLLIILAVIIGIIIFGWAVLSKLRRNYLDEKVMKDNCVTKTQGRVLAGQELDDFYKQFFPIFEAAINGPEPGMRARKAFTPTFTVLGSDGTHYVFCWIQKWDKIVLDGRVAISFYASETYSEQAVIIVKNGKVTDIMNKQEAADEFNLPIKT